ncbi:MAG: helix-turn-helix domain-containing protein [Lachnospiraceae bacterium]|nr:helix-turn-helix domain-containing protein [Lachnospiraceae bacterium]
MSLPLAHNPFGNDELKITKETSAERIGERIRSIREEKGLSRYDLAETSGLDYDRICKYENGQRKPSDDVIRIMANALHISPLALSDPTTYGEINAMFALFELECIHDLQMVKKNNQVYLFFDDKSGNSFGSLNKYVEAWYEQKCLKDKAIKETDDEDEIKQIIYQYNNWKYNFPSEMVDNLRIDYLKKKIAKEQAELDKLEKKNQK